MASAPPTSIRAPRPGSNDVRPVRTSPRAGKTKSTGASSVTVGKCPSSFLRRDRLMARFNESKVQKAHLLAAKVDAEEKVIDLHESYRVQVLEIIKAEPEAQNAGTAEAALMAVQNVHTRFRAECAQSGKDKTSAIRRATRAEGKVNKLEEKVAELMEELEELKSEQALDRMTMDAYLAEADD